MASEFSLHNLILQGSVLGPIKCIVQQDTLGKEVLSENSSVYTPYKYLGIVDIPPLNMMDDCLSITECGNETLLMNAIINAKIETKKLRLSSDKCFLLHIEKRRSNVSSNCNVNVFVHSSIMKRVSKATYMGDILNSDGSFNDTIDDRKKKAIGISNQIMTIVSSVSLGMYHFQICFMLRNFTYGPKN